LYEPSCDLQDATKKVILEYKKKQNEEPAVMYQNNSLNQYPAFWSVTILIFGQTDFENMWLEV
jgi:hypothetical protein